MEVYTSACKRVSKNNMIKPSEMKYTIAEVIAIAFVIGALMMLVGKLFNPMIPTCEILIR